jgi:hypothetical protein
MNQIRKIRRVVAGSNQVDGAGVKLVQVIGPVEEFDPLCHTGEGRYLVLSGTSRIPVFPRQAGTKQSTGMTNKGVVQRSLRYLR